MYSGHEHSSASRPHCEPAVKGRQKKGRSDTQTGEEEGMAGKGSNKHRVKPSKSQVAQLTE